MIKTSQAQLDTRLHLVKKLVIRTQNQRDSCCLSGRAKRTLEGSIKPQTKKDEKAACGSEGLGVRRIMNPVQPGEYHKLQVNLDS